MKLDRKNLIRICIAIFVLYLCIHYWPAVSEFALTLFGAASPLLIGGAVAYVLNLLMKFYERLWFPKAKKKWLNRSRSPICLVLALFTLIAIVVGVVWLVLPQLISGITLLISQLPGAITKLIVWLDGLEFMPQDIISTLQSIDWQSRVGEIFNVLYSGMGSVMNVIVSTVSSVFNGIVTAFLAIIFAIYLLLSKKTLGRQIKRVLNRYLPEKITGKLYYGVGILNDCFSRYIVGQCTEAAILGVLCVLGMWILRLPYAPMIAALIAVTALIPVAGAYIGGGVGAFLILTISPVKAIVFLVFLVILQQLEGNLIYPRVVGSSIGLPALWVLAAVTVGGGVMGVLGMLLAVPLTATLWQLLRNDLNKEKPQV
ncbi:MAG: AI-2E family transporter [Clostridia bacterium]|nr:AI-2E family transporter [Clostridia bacterium]